MQKKEIRANIRALKKEIGAEKLLAFSQANASVVLDIESFKCADVVMLYAALWDEVNVDVLFESVLLMGKKLILPTVVGDDIVPIEVSKSTEWRVGDFNIKEPIGERYVGDIDFCLVPGVAFDCQKHRLGRGKGYYDRFFAQYNVAHKVGICFDFQLVEHIEVEQHDVPMEDLIVIKRDENMA